MESSKLYGKHTLQPGETRFFYSEIFSFGIKRETEGWLFKTVYEKPQEDIPEETSITGGEYFHTGKSNSIVISPALPEKPLVFKGNHIKVTAGQKLTFFLKIPLSVQIFFSKAVPENLLKEIPSRQLSHTWFGEPDNGEIALAYGSEYFLDFESLIPTPFEAICPIVIINHSPSTLEVQRLIIRTENLSIYQNKDKKVTSVVEIEFEGQDSINSAEYHYSKNYDGEKQEILAKPRNNNGRNPLKMNLHFIKNIYKTE